MKTENFAIRPATLADVPIILELIRALATYERAPNDVTATEKGLAEVLFGENPAAEVLLAFENETAVGFAVFFHNFSTWLGRPGLYLEDLFVRPEDRGKGYGRALLIHLAKIARDRGCGRLDGRATRKHRCDGADLRCRDHDASRRGAAGQRVPSADKAGTAGCRPLLSCAPGH